MTYPGQQPSTGPQWGPPPGSQYPYQQVPQSGYTVHPGAYRPVAPGYGPPMRLVPAAPNGQPLASFADRLVAYIIDALITGAVWIVMLIPAVVLMFSIIDNAVEETVTDPNTGQVISEPDAASVILPIIGIWLALLVGVLIVTYVYYVEMMYKRGSTVGKRVMKLRIIRLDQPDRPLTRGIATRRWLIGHVAASVVPFLSYLDGLWQLWDKPFQQCLHDKWAKTVVVKVSP